jgi:hypothetical protein
MEMKFLAVVVAVVAIMAPCSQALTCYDCSGDSGFDTTDTTTKFYCGLPFKYDSAATTKPNWIVNCDGVCVTQSYYSGSSTTIYRSCSDAPVKDGCERTVGTLGQIYWTCIKTCTTDRCNDNSAASTLLPVAMLLLLSAVVPAIGRRIL